MIRCIFSDKTREFERTYRNIKELCNDASWWFAKNTLRTVIIKIYNLTEEDELFFIDKEFSNISEHDLEVFSNFSNIAKMYLLQKLNK